MSAADKEFRPGITMRKWSTPDGITMRKWSTSDGKTVGFVMYADMRIPAAKARVMELMALRGTAGRSLLETSQQADPERHE